MDSSQPRIVPEKGAEGEAERDPVPSIEASPDVNPLSKQQDSSSTEQPPNGDLVPDPNADSGLQSARPPNSTLQIPSNLSSSISSPTLPLQPPRAAPTSWKIRSASSLGRLGTKTDGDWIEGGRSGEVIQDDGEMAEDEGNSPERDDFPSDDKEGGPKLRRSRSSSAKKALGSAIGSIKRRMGIGGKEKKQIGKGKEEDSWEIVEDSKRKSRQALHHSTSSGLLLQEKKSNTDGNATLRVDYGNRIEDGSSDGLTADRNIAQGNEAAVKRKTSFRESIRAKRESFRLLLNKQPVPDTFEFAARVGSTGYGPTSPNTTKRYSEKLEQEQEEQNNAEVVDDSNLAANDSTAIVTSPVDINDDDEAAVNNKDDESERPRSMMQPSIQAVIVPGNAEARPGLGQHAATAPPSSSASSIRAEKSVESNAAETVQKSQIPLMDYDRSVKSLDSGLQNNANKSKRPELPRNPSSSSSVPKTTNGAVEALDGLEDIAIPEKWLTGSVMIKVSEKEEKRRKVRLDPEQGYLLWETKKGGIITVENIKEIRIGADTHYYRKLYEMPPDYEKRWLTISYLVDGKYRTLHLVAISMGDFSSFYDSLVRLRALRQAMLSFPSNPGLAPLALPDANVVQTSVPVHDDENQSVGSHSHSQSHGQRHGHHRLHISTHPNSHGHSHHQSHSQSHGHSHLHRHLTLEQRQTLWERHYWKGADVSGDKRLDYSEVKKMVHRMSMGLSSSELDKLFRAADRSGNGTLDFEEFREFWRGRRVRKEMKHLFKNQLSFNEPEVKSESDGQPTSKEDRLEGLTFKTFERFMREEQKDKRSTAELQEIFALYATPCHSPKVDTEDSALQSDSPNSEADAAGVNRQQVLALEGFTSYLMSSDNAPFKEQNLGVSHDMTRPLSEYYISSSHNTYLVGHQLVGDSTIEGYIRTLLHGCRSVEIDIWDGDKEPVITHGGTLTSKIALRTICEVIAKNAFTASPYPVIISAEVHCGVIQQDKIAEIVKECFGDMLVDRRLEPGEDINDPLKELPSPEMLKGKILLKTKKPVNLMSGTDIAAITGTAIETDGGTETAVTSDPEILPMERRGSSSRRGSRSSVRRQIPIPRQSTKEFDDGESILIVGSNSSQGHSIHSRRPSMPRAKPFSCALANLLVYTVGVKCRGLNKKEDYAPEHMFSLSEKKVDKMLKEGGVYYVVEDSNGEDDFVSRNPSGGMLDLIKHTQGHLVRTYPKGLRLSSSNYLPHRYWAAGIQLVALNWQTSDLGCMINHAMFLRNGKAGYVLKPACLRSKEKKVKEIVTKRKRYCLGVKVISAQQIPRPRNKDGREIVSKSTMDPYVQVSVYVPDWPGSPNRPGAPGMNSYQNSTSPPKASPLRRDQTDATVKPLRGYVLQSASTPAEVVKGQTGIVKNNGFNPIWNDQLQLPFDVSGEMLDLVFIRFAVYTEGDNEDATPLAMYCISLGTLNQGYRHLPLHDQQMSQYLFASLFVKLDLREVTP
ncbi:Phospholipase C [Serendipita sp. 405]|nr:Phospholipase C [Serendipita sp. 405]